tara:strand:- start:2293 stop:3120 length:828 start_codon:yes stop_codon:yes gene_type:complete
MSSIYRKGRDGYYYYQTYLYNPQSGKKDKKIFHSLGTKDQNEAKIKQDEYDNLYKENPSEHNLNIPKISLVEKIKIPAIIICILFICLKIIDINFDRLEHKKEQNPIIHFNTEKINDKKKKLSSETKSSPLTKSTNKIEIKNDNEYYDKPILDNIVEAEKEPSQTEIITPKYEIVRVDRLSDTFDQGKIYVIVEKNYNDAGLISLCNKIRERYEEFSNIIICIYSDTKIGLSLANGNDQNINTDRHNKEWLVMYSYNAVEGEYYDNNPGRYLGAY